MKNSSGQSAILHDAYFNRPPRLIGLFLIRLALLCALSACAVWSLTDLYLLRELQLPLCLAAAGFTAVLFTLTSLLPSGFVYFGTAALGGLTCFLLREPLLRQLSFFADRLLLRLDSRLISTKPLLFHRYERLVSGYYNEELRTGWLVGMLLLCAVIAFLFTICARTRFRPLAAAAVFGGLSAASFAAEISGFHPSIIAFVSVFSALYTVDTGYELDGKLVFGKTRAAHEAMRRNERSYRKRTRFFRLGKKLRSDLPRYFKYNANSFAALLVSAAVLIAAAVVIPEGQGFDYEAFFTSVRDAGVTVADSVGGALGVSFGSINDNGYFSYSGYGDRSGGIGISEPAEGDLPVLDVILDRNDTPVYLRGDIGVTYTGGAWSAIRDEYERFIDESGLTFAEELDGFYPDLQYQVLRQRLSSLGYNPDRLFPLQKVSITYRRNTKVVFQPVAAYELGFRDNDYFETFGDYILRARSGKGYLKTFESLSLTPFMANSYMSEAITLAKRSGDLSWTLPDGMTNREYAAKIAVYDRFVDRAYTKSDAAVFAFIEEMREKNVIGGLSDFDTASAVCRYFKDHFTYSLTTDNGTPEESLERFLYETREGHCALFATSMVLIMRELGIPARYVTGYAASGEGEPTEDGRFRYTLREGDLHAWVEVYFENAGWLPFDPTAAVSGFEGNTAEAAEPDPGASDPFEEETPPDVTTDSTEIVTTALDPDVPSETQAEYGDENGDPAGFNDREHSEEDDPSLPPEEGREDESPAYSADENPAGNGTPSAPHRNVGEIFVELLPYLTAAAIVLAFAAVIVLFIRSVGRAEEKAFRGFRKKPSERAVAEMYRLVILLLSREGIAPETETLTDFAVRADASPVLKGLNVFLADVMPIFMKCEFGDPSVSPVTEEERLSVLKLTTALYRRVIGKKNPLFAFFTKISLFL